MTRSVTRGLRGADAGLRPSVSKSGRRHCDDVGYHDPARELRVARSAAVAEVGTISLFPPRSRADFPRPFRLCRRAPSRGRYGGTGSRRRVEPAYVRRNLFRLSLMAVRRDSLVCDHDRTDDMFWDTGFPRTAGRQPAKRSRHCHPHCCEGSLAEHRLWANVCPAGVHAAPSRGRRFR